MAPEHRQDTVVYEEGSFVNSRGIKLFTCQWFPASGRICRALIFLCHGYGMECSIHLRDVGLTLAREGYGVIGIDVEGHGKSEGLRCYLPSFAQMVDDSRSFFQTVWDREEHRNKPRFLYGESMGGATALLLHMKEPDLWNGAILLAPMCKISDKLKPPEFVSSIMKLLVGVIPTWKIVPVKDIIEVGFKDPAKRKEIYNNAYVYRDKPRLRTAWELLQASTSLERSLDKVKLPFLVLHGEEDVVTEIEISRALFETSSSSDKTFKRYSGMWHSLIVGEPPQNSDVVFRDILHWLRDRTHQAQESFAATDKLPEQPRPWSQNAPRSHI